MEKNELLKLMSNHAQARRFNEGEIIVKEGDPPTEGICFVLAGSIRIFQAQNGRNIPLGYVQAGQFFGETAMLLNRPRGASAMVYSSSAAILFIDSKTFMAQAHENYSLIKALFAEGRQRVEHILQAILRTHREFTIMVDPSLQPIIRENRANNLKIPGLLNHVRHILIAQGKPVFEQNQKNDGTIFLVTKGHISARCTFGTETKEVSTFEEGDFFGYSHADTVPTREYSAIASGGDTAHVVSFDEELLFRLLRLDVHMFYIMFRSIITQLVILDDTFRLTATALQSKPGSEQSHQEILKGFEEPPPSPPPVPEADATGSPGDVPTDIPSEPEENTEAPAPDV